MKGLKADEMGAIELADDMSECRFVFQQGDRGFWVSFPTDDLLAMLPIIIKTAQHAQNPERPVAITVSNGSVDLDQDGDCLLTLENTAGAEMTFHLPKDILVSISALLDSALSSQSGSTATH